MHDRLNVPPDLLHLVEKRSGKDRREETDEAQVDVESDRPNAESTPAPAEDAASDMSPPQQSTGPMDVERRKSKRRKTD